MLGTDYEISFIKGNQGYLAKNTDELIPTDKKYIYSQNKPPSKV